MDLVDAQVLLTGATGGIGHAMARTFAEAGTRLTLTGRRTEVLEPLLAELGGEAAGHRALAIDLTEAAEVERLVAEAGAIDVLVANAALPASGPIDDFSVAQIDRALDVNLRAPIVLARALSAGMAQRGRGHVVLMSSLAGKAATPGSALYAATKYGIRGFGAGLRGDLRAHGVGVSVVFPGFIRDAGMFAESGTRLPRGVGTRTPDDVARATLDAVRNNRGEVDVAPPSMRAGTKLAQLAPEVAATVTRRLGSEQISSRLAEGQRDKR